MSLLETIKKMATDDPEHPWTANVVLMLVAELEKYEATPLASAGLSCLYCDYRTIPANPVASEEEQLHAHYLKEHPNGEDDAVTPTEGVEHGHEDVDHNQGYLHVHEGGQRKHNHGDLFLWTGPPVPSPWVSDDARDNPAISTRCRQGRHVMCPEKAGIGKDCECECHQATLDVTEERWSCSCGIARISFDPLKTTVRRAVCLKCGDAYPSRSAPSASTSLNYLEAIREVRKVLPSPRFYFNSFSTARAIVEALGWKSARDEADTS